MAMHKLFSTFQENSGCCGQAGFRSVVVITFASHAKGPQFETGWKQMCLFPRLLKSGSVAFLGNTTKASPA